MPSVSPVPDTPPEKHTPAKRKRSLSDPTVIPFAPDLSRDTLEDGSSYELKRATSPQTVVTERLSDLRIHGQLSAFHFGFLEDDQRLKKARQEACHGLDRLKTDGEGERIPAMSVAASIEGKEEVLAHGTDSRPSPNQGCPMDSLSRNTIVSEGDKEAELLEANATTAESAKFMVDSPADAKSLSTTTAQGTQLSTTADTGLPKPPKKATKRSATENANNDTAPAYTEALDPDDDGTGINGIGFRPTPTEAWARSQRRKQQISDWRAREEREARERRSANRRNRGAAMAKHHQQPSQHGTTMAALATMDSTLSTKPRVRFAS